MSIRDRFLAAWRVACHTLWIALIVWLAGRGIRIPEHWASLVELALIGAGAGVWAAGVGWLQTRTGSAWWAKLARGVGRFLVLGNITVPSYPTRPAPTPPAPPVAPVPAG